MNDLLFDTSWWLLVLLICGGIGIWYVGNTRLDAKIKWAGLAVLLLGIALALLSYFVDTDKEIVTKRTRQLVTSVVDRNWDAFASLLDPNTSFANAYRNRGQIVDGAKKTVDLIGLKSASITSVEVTQNDSVITVNLNAMSTQDATMDRPLPSSWRFDWQNTGSGWKLAEIEPLDGSQVKKDEILGRLAR
jgi:hypothetical protein